MKNRPISLKEIISKIELLEEREAELTYDLEIVRTDLGNLYRLKELNS